MGDLKPYNQRKNYNQIWKYINLTNIRKLIKFIRVYGFKTCKAKILNKLNNSTDSITYQKWFERHRVTEEQQSMQRKHVFENFVVVSIVVPVYNTPELFLREMIESVINQTYSNWELCLADGGSDQETINILSEYEKKDIRIKIKYLNENRGISENTNRALDMATGSYIALLDHDDIITPDALFEIVKVINEQCLPDFIYTDEDKIDSKSGKLFDPHFKPDFSPDTLRSYNYITHFSVFSRELLDKVGYFNSQYDGSQDYDMILRLTEKADKIIHIPKILYHWRMHKDSVALNPASKLYAYTAAKKTLASHLNRIGLKGDVVDGKFLGCYKEEYKIDSEPLVSIIILSKANAKNLEECINSIITVSKYKKFEIIIMASDLTIKNTENYVRKLGSYFSIKVIGYKQEYNDAQINNYACEYAKGEYLVLLNVNTKVITKDWIEQMIMYCERDDVAAVGGKLYYVNNTIYNSGIIVGLSGESWKMNYGSLKEEVGYFGRAVIVQNLSAVSSECMMIKKNIFNDINGFNVEYNSELKDIDLCLRLREKGYLLVFNPYIELYINKSINTQKEDMQLQLDVLKEEAKYLSANWKHVLKKGDPYYNLNLTLENARLALKE